MEPLRAATYLTTNLAKPAPAEQRAAGENYRQFVGLKERAQNNLANSPGDFESPGELASAKLTKLFCARS